MVAQSSQPGGTLRLPTHTRTTQRSREVIVTKIRKRVARARCGPTYRKWRAASSGAANLQPLLELTPVIRPRLLLAAPVAGVGPVLLALLYHREKDAFQSRLRFRLPGQSEFLRRTKWRSFPDPTSLQRRREKIRRCPSLHPNQDFSRKKVPRANETDDSQ